jgi:hypothetical protein
MAPKTFAAFRKKIVYIVLEAGPNTKYAQKGRPELTWISHVGTPPCIFALYS